MHAAQVSGCGPPRKSPWVAMWLELMTACEHLLLVAASAALLKSGDHLMHLDLVAVVSSSTQRGSTSSELGAGYLICRGRGGGVAGRAAIGARAGVAAPGCPGRRGR
jgi:hypothetical protein